MPKTHLTWTTAAALGAAVSLSAQQPSLDYTQWRGQNRDGGASAFVAPRSWPETLAQQWKVDVGLGYATPLVAGNRVYVFARRGENEVMAALDAATGKELWQTGYQATFTMNKATARHNAGPKSTPALAAGRLFSIGMTGIVSAFDASTGRQVWQHPGSDVVPMFTTHSFSPVVVGGLVVFHVGGHDKGALTAFDVNTGAPKWTWPGDGPSYGSPIVADLAGVRQVIALTQSKLVGVEAATGALLWERPFESRNFTNAATPILFGDTLILSNGGPVAAIRVARRDGTWVTEEAWTNPDVPYRLSNPVLLGDRVFGLSQRNSGQYFSLDAKTGKTLWTSGERQAGNAAIVKAGDLWFSLEDDGELVVLSTGAAGFEPLRRYKVAETDTWTQPTISGNRFFVKDVSTLTLWTLN